MREAQSSLRSLGSEATLPPLDAAELGRFLYRAIVFMKPERVVHPPSWLDYIPFAFWIVGALRPAALVISSGRRARLPVRRLTTEQAREILAFGVPRS